MMKKVERERREQLLKKIQRASRDRKFIYEKENGLLFFIIIIITINFLGLNYIRYLCLVSPINGAALHLIIR